MTEGGVDGQTQQVNYTGQAFHGDSVDHRLDQVLHRDWQATLTTDRFEEVEGALSEVQALRGWRQEADRSSFSPFFNFFEGASAIAAADISHEVKAELREHLSDRLVPHAHRLSPRVADLYMAFLAQLDGSEYTPEFDMTVTQLENLAAADEGGMSDLDILLDPNVSFELKKNRMDTRITSELRGRRGLDKRDKQTAEKQIEAPPSEPETPPPAQDESKPSMDEMERLKEGETASPIWTIQPAYGGYYRNQSFDKWDPQTNTWKQGYSFESYDVPDKASIEEHTVMTAHVPAEQWTRIPVPYTHDIIGFFGAGDAGISFQKDENGDTLVKTTSDIPLRMSFFLSPREDNEAKHTLPPTEQPSFQAQLTFETEEMLTRIRKLNITHAEKAHKLAAYTMRRLKYSNDSSYNSQYDSHENGYVGAIDRLKQADCDVANTYFAALCSELDIPARHVVGHMVKGQDENGISAITSGTGHAWTEVWDDQERQWVRIDATPPGDPQLENDDQTMESAPGDYGGQEAIGPTDEELAALEEELAQKAEELSYTQKERALAQEAGVELAEARQIVQEIQTAEDIRIPNGERIVDVLSNLFNLIVETRKAHVSDYTGPLRKREGGDEIEDIVNHAIGVRSGETDPVSRNKPDEIIEEELIFGGLDAIFIGDKSSSMSQTVDGEAKWVAQRRALYLLLSSLHRFEQNLQRSGVSMKDPLSVRTQAISFRDSHQIDEDKPLSGEFSSLDKVKLWQSLGNQGRGNGDIPALRLIKKQIESEKNEAEETGKVDNRLRIIFACSDGYPDDSASVQRLAQELGKMGAVTIGVGITETAGNVPVIFDTPVSRGVVVKDIDDLPAVVGREVVTEAIKLIPAKARASALRQIETILAKFEAVS